MRNRTGISIERVEMPGGKDQADACRAVLREVMAAEDPTGPVMSRRTFGGWLTVGWAAEPREAWLARDTGAHDGEAGDGGDRGVLGWYLLELPDRDNPELAELSLQVRPPARWRGIGSMLLRHAMDRARADGRTVITGFAWPPPSGGEPFARAFGATPGIIYLRRVLDVRAIPAGHLDRLRAAAEPPAAGYSLLTWTGVTPEEHLDQVAAVNLTMDDAPHDASRQGSVWDAQRVRDTDQRMLLQGHRHYTVAARHDATGELAGLTSLAVDPEMPEWGFQELTAVATAHRGHRLGLLLKVTMLRQLAQAEPQAERVAAWNAATNDHMVAINETLGYQIADPPIRSWELKIR